MKVIHSVSPQEFDEARTFKKKYTFILPGEMPAKALCGLNKPQWIACEWAVITCKKCLKKREALK